LKADLLTLILGNEVKVINLDNIKEFFIHENRVCFVEKGSKFVFFEIDTIGLAEAIDVVKLITLKYQRIFSGDELQITSFNHNFKEMDHSQSSPVDLLNISAPGSNDVEINLSGVGLIYKQGSNLVFANDGKLVMATIICNSSSTVDLIMSDIHSGERKISRTSSEILDIDL